MTLVRADLSELNRRINLMRTGATGSGRAAAHELGYLGAGQAVKFTLQAQVNDTGRYLRAWQDVYNQFARLAGHPSIPLQPLRPSRYTGQNLDRLRSQVVKWREIQRRWALRRGSVERHPRHTLWPSYQRLLKLQAKVDRILARAETTLEVYQSNDGTAVVIGGRRTKMQVSYSRLASIRTKLYGGSATIAFIAGKWWARGANMEPHARLVEYGIRKIARDSETGVTTTTTVRARRIAYDIMRNMRRIVAHPDSAVKRAYMKHLRDIGALQKKRGAA